MNKTILLLSLLFLTSAATHRSAPVRTGQDFALFFAVDQYQHPNLADLKNPIKNATDIAGVLHERFGFDTLVLRNPTQEQIEQKLYEYHEKYARNLDGRHPSTGQLLLFFSGHGKEYFGNGHFLPSDADPAAPHRTGFEYSLLRNLLNSFNCQHILVAVDACYSVNFDPNKDNRPDHDFKRIGELTETEKALYNHSQHKSRLFFTSDAIGDMTPDRSNFARKLLEGLDAFQSPTGYMTSSELFANYVQKASPSPRGGDFGDDDPRSAFLFFFERQVAPPIDPVADREAWDEAKAANTAESYRKYLNRYPPGEFVELARFRLDQLEAADRDYEAWQRAKQTNTIEGYQKYLDDFQSGDYRDLADHSLNNLKSQQPKDPTTQPSNMVFVEGGTFTMGCTNEQASDCDSDEKPTHQATVKSFFMGKYEVTNKEFCEFLNAVRPSVKGEEVKYNGNLIYDLVCSGCSGYTDRIKYAGNSFFSLASRYENHPVTLVTWYGAGEYCKWLDQKTGKPYRLPTEAEWEYAARGGKNSRGYKYSGSDTLIDVGWFADNSSGGTKPVGQKMANELKIYDMSANVWEWCLDNWNESYNGIPANDEAWLSGDSTRRVLRGGSWEGDSRYCRVSNRNRDEADCRNGNDVGFRVVQDSK